MGKFFIVNLPKTRTTAPQSMRLWRRVGFCGVCYLGEPLSSCNATMVWLQSRWIFPGSSNILFHPFGVAKTAMY